MRSVTGILAMVVVVTAAAAAFNPAHSQTPAPGASRAPTAANDPRVHFAKALKLDGELDEVAWAAADSIDEFIQRDPREGSPGSERTVVRFVGTTDGLWIGVRANDQDPRGIRRTQLRRDADMGADDHVTLMLSPTADKRTAFLFTVNPNGAMHDSEVLSFESESAEWDGIWDARARVTSDGWQAEIFIPWQTLRYRKVGADSAADAWDMNVRRFIRRRNESMLWHAWKRTEGIRFLDRAGSLRGFSAAGAVDPGTAATSHRRAPPVCDLGCTHDGA
jgi:hypothetical protein